MQYPNFATAPSLIQCIVSDRVLVFICEDMENFKGGEEEMARAQERVLELFRNIQM